jgi:hypothetical protein
MHSSSQHTYRRAGSVAVVMGILLSATAARSQTQDKPNFAGIEFLGQGILYTANYERYVNRFGVGIGFAAWHIDETALVVPVYVSFRPIGGATHRMYLSAGATLSNDAVRLAPSRIAYGTASVGYEHVSKSGFVFRPAYTLLYGSGDTMLWPQFTIGYRF